MIKQPQLWDALQHPGEISSDTVAEMQATVRKYPYFQLWHTRIAKAKHDQQTPDAYDALGTAAVYAPDRRLLRQVFYDELVLTIPASNESFASIEDPSPAAPEDDADSVIEKDELPVVEEPPAEEETAEIATEEIEAEDPETLREELTQTLQVLQGSKEKLPDSIEATETPDTEAPLAESGPAATEEQPPLSDQLEQISEETTPHSSNQSEQQDIIDRFVKANPSITRDGAAERTNDTDLSAESTELSNSIVTENLAEIMLKQGKTDKAIDLYQKLILKYPEKKAYFAQKIDQLNNN